ncbi:MAG: Hsp20/alpha crystallin family protein [Nitrospirae bacterium]|nr:MAG: Hsp20/alpha crystallin family protein [Nitrospirota bacterium]
MRKPLELPVSWDRDVDRTFGLFDRMMEEFWRRPFLSPWEPERLWPSRAVSMRLPALDVYEEKDAVIVKADLPGLSKEDVEVKLTGRTLTIKGEKKKEEEVKEKNYYRRERSYGSFVRSVELPTDVKPDEIKATFHDGVIEVRLPKTEEAKKQSITVTID